MPQARKHESLYMQAERQLMHYLDEVPFIRWTQGVVDRIACDMDADLVLELDIQGQSQYLAVVVKHNGQPRTAKDAIYRLRSAQTALAESYPVFIAPYISPRVAALCQQEGVGYADFAGNCLLSFDRVYLKREQFPNPAIERRELRSLFTRKATAIYRILLRAPRDIYTLSALSQASTVSLGQVHNVVEMLIAREWMQRLPDGVQLTDPEPLLRSWAQQYTFPAHARYEYYTDQPLGTIERQVASCATDDTYAGVLTGFAGAERLAPYTRYQRIHAWIPRDVEAVAQSLGLKAVSSGANVTLYLAKEESVFFDRRRVGETCVASPIQVYLDLLRVGGRSEDAAQHLLDTVIKPSW